MTTLVAFLDLAVCPVSYDAVIFMAQAEMERKRVGAARLHVVLFGDLRKKPAQYDDAEAEWRLWNIVVPAARLFGATISVTPGRSWHRAYGELIPGEFFWPDRWEFQEHELRKGIRHHLIGGLINRTSSGAAIARPRASEHARRKVCAWMTGRAVTMTVREADYLDERNSDATLWGTVARAIAERGFKVYRIRDTTRALEIGSGYGELNLDLRMAMYERADYNIVANCGPASLCWLSDVPYLMAGAGYPADEWHGLFVKQGLPLGVNWPWALPHQTLLYGKETADQVIAEFDRWASATN